jgi:diadenylate cyclase
VSYASGGELHTAVTPSDLREQLHKIQKLAKKPEEKKGWHIRGMRQKVEGEKK